MIKRRVNKFNSNFPDAIELMVRGLRSGLPITETLGIVGGEIRSEEHTSELQSPVHVVCRLQPEEKKKWHKGPTVLEALDFLEPQSTEVHLPLRFCLHPYTTLFRSR